MRWLAPSPLAGEGWGEGEFKTATERLSKESKLSLLISAEEIRARVQTVAADISRDLSGSDLLIVAALKGAFVFLADLVRNLDFPVEIDFIRLQSYGMNTTPCQVRLVSDLTTPVRGRNILIVDDIVDTGQSLDYLIRLLKTRGASSVRACVLLDKPSRRTVDVRVDYVGFTIPDVFVAGYGIDFAEQYRQLAGVYEVSS